MSVLFQRFYEQFLQQGDWWTACDGHMTTCHYPHPHQVTGRCTCLPNVGSSQDSNCCSCSYGSFDLNTTTGCQSEYQFTNGKGVMVVM